MNILLSLGDDYLKGGVIEGEARNRDIAKKGSAASLVVPVEDRY